MFNNSKSKIEKQKDNENIGHLCSQMNELSSKYNKMLTPQPKIKVIEAPTKKEFEDKYNEFANTIKNDRRGRLGSIFSMEKPTITYNNGNFVYIVEYIIFGLKDGVSEEDYNDMINKYDESVKKYESAKKEYDDKYLNNI